MLILAVDDDFEDLSLLSEAVLTIEPKVKVVCAHDGVQALQLIDELIVLPDLVFLDINMPKMDGKQFLRQIKTDERTRGIRVVMYSTTSNPKEMAECRALGAEIFLIKPPTYAELIKELKFLFPPAPC